MGLAPTPSEGVGFEAYSDRGFRLVVTTALRHRALLGLTLHWHCFPLSSCYYPLSLVTQTRIRKLGLSPCGPPVTLIARGLRSTYQVVGQFKFAVGRDWLLNCAEDWSTCSLRLAEGHAPPKGKTQVQLLQGALILDPVDK